jgi:hypothetical protein
MHVKLIPETAAWHDEVDMETRSSLFNPIPSNNCENFLSFAPNELTFCCLFDDFDFHVMYLRIS